MLASAVLNRLAGGALLGLKAPGLEVVVGAAPDEGFSGEPIVRRCSCAYPGAVSKNKTTTTSQIFCIVAPP